MGWKRVEDRKRLPNKSGLYAIYQKDNDRLLYIGKSINLFIRFSDHDSTGKHRDINYLIGRDNIYIKYRLTEFFFTEKSLIKRLKPPYNDCHNSDKRKQRAMRRKVA